MVGVGQSGGAARARARVRAETHPSKLELDLRRLEHVLGHVVESPQHPKTKRDPICGLNPADLHLVHRWEAEGPVSQFPGEYTVPGKFPAWRVP